MVFSSPSGSPGMRDVAKQFKCVVIYEGHAPSGAEYLVGGTTRRYADLLAMSNLGGPEA
jgi:hypothetical protein